MSGIVGLIRTNGDRIEPVLVRALGALLAGRGPDAQAVHCDGPAAFGHALLRTGPESDADRQPLSLDGRTWIVADARVDARSVLTARLEADHRTTLRSASDAELILRAYLTWGDRCVDYLLGDFAFAIWDREAQRLFCARDHLGVKPFYYADAGGWLVVSGALECVRGHPVVSDRLNDAAIADFLLFGFNQDSGTTAWSDIRRVPPAHTLTWSRAGLDLRRYWTLPIEDPLYDRQDHEYVDEFTGLLQQAVSDRLRTERIGIFMSGGIDSPILAATALELLGRSARPAPVRAFTYMYESLLEDQERRYATAVAEHLGIPIHCYALDELPGWPPPGTATPEPVAPTIGQAAVTRCCADMAAHSRVAFFGEGPDNALGYEWRPQLAHLWRRRQWGRLLADGQRFLVHHKRVPLLSSIPRMIRARLQHGQYEPAFPDWISPDLVARLHLRDRWRAVHSGSEMRHPFRPRAYASLESPLWQSVFETLEPSYTGVPLEVRHPYVDLRLLQFLLRVPAVPWCRQKHLLRRASRGVLPDAVRRRPKTPVGDPGYEQVRRHGLPAVCATSRLATYGSTDRLAGVRPARRSTVEADLRFAALSHWLHRLELERGIGAGAGRPAPLGGSGSS
jgi:asparagine synthase (glutamine-hydrolysing)